MQPRIRRITITNFHRLTVSPLFSVYFKERIEEVRDMAGGNFRFAIDRGGTFTDVYAECRNGEVRVMKLLSVDPAYPDAPREGIRRILQEVLRM